MSEKVVVTDGTDSFFQSRMIFQYLHDFGDFSRVTAFSSSVTEAKKMLLSRQARYSGLVDVLDFAEGGDVELSAALGGASTWIVVNADSKAVVGQLEAAAAAGVKRAFIHLSATEASDVDVAALTAALEASSLDYTVMRTGSMSKEGSGGGLVVSELDLPTCDEVPTDDVWRFVVESLTIDEANGRSFSLCPSSDASQLKAMRLAGCTRREEVEALLKGVIKEGAEAPAADAEPAADGADEASPDEAESDEEAKAKREEELKMLLERARVRGIETQKKMAEEEAIKQQKRAERATYFAQNSPSEDGEGKDGTDDDSKDDSSPPEGGESKGDGDGGTPKKDGDGDGDDDDGLALV